MVKNPAVKEILDWLLHIAIAVVVGLLIVNFVFQRTVVHSYSMEPTLHEGDNLLVEKISPRLGRLMRGDIVTINVPEFVPQENNPIIKRIIGVENDTIEIKNGKVYVNGREKVENYINGDSTQPENPEYSKITVPKGCIYVLGDNRKARIVDSRTIGTINIQKVAGKAFFRIFPLNKFGTLKR